MIGLLLLLTVRKVERVVHVPASIRQEGKREGNKKERPRSGTEVRPDPEGNKDRIAIIIDDLGAGYREFSEVERLHPGISFAVLPFQPYSVRIAREAHRSGHDLLLHLPMEPEGNENPGIGAIFRSMPEWEVQKQVREDLEAVPYVRGVNNHMGSLTTSDPVEMRLILKEIRARNLFFVDSRTSSRSIAYSEAVKLGIPSAERQVFLDDGERPEEIRAQFSRLSHLAHENGFAIAIGHPRRETIKALKAYLAGLSRENLRLVPVSDLVR